MEVKWRVSPTQGWSTSKLKEHAVNAAELVMNAWAPMLETEMKNNAPWTDRTANARQGLSVEVRREGPLTVVLVAFSWVHYQIYLELKQQGQSILSPELSQAGKYAVILPTMESHQEEIIEEIREVLQI